MYGRLPPHSAVVAHNYFVARILNYLDFSDEYEPDPSPEFLANDASAVRAAAAEGRQVYALAEAVPWLTSQGLRFAPTTLSRQPLDRWVEDQPDGTVVVVAAAGRLLPLEWLPSQIRESGARRTNFSALAWTLGQEPHLGQSNDPLSLTHAAPDGRAIAVAADDTGVRLTWGEDVIGAIDRGLMVMAVRPTGRLIGSSAFTPEEEPGILLTPQVFIFQDELPCGVLRTGQAVDVSPIVSEGGWYATVDGRQIPATIAVAGGGSPADWRHQLANGRGKAAIDAAGSRLLLDGAPGTRAVFRFSLPPNQPKVLATLESSEHSFRVCQIPVPQLSPTGAFETGPAADAHFGVGWHSAEDAGTKHFRWSRRSSTLRWRMDAAQPVRFILPLRAAHAGGATIRASINGAEAGACALPKATWTDCRIEIDAARIRSGINDLTLTSDTIAPAREGDPRELAFEMQAGRVRVGR
jgi:hypothetical protein